MTTDPWLQHWPTTIPLQPPTTLCAAPLCTVQHVQCLRSFHKQTLCQCVCVQCVCMCVLHGKISKQEAVRAGVRCCGRACHAIRIVIAGPEYTCRVIKSCVRWVDSTGRQTGGGIYSIGFPRHLLFIPIVLFFFPHCLTLCISSPSHIAYTTPPSKTRLNKGKGKENRKRDV